MWVTMDVLDTRDYWVGPRVLGVDTRVYKAGDTDKLWASGLSKTVWGFWLRTRGTWDSDSNMIKQITAKMNNQTYVVKGIFFLYCAPPNLCLTTVIKEGAWGHIPLHLPSHSLPLVIWSPISSKMFFLGQFIIKIYCPTSVSFPELLQPVFLQQETHWEHFLC
jgi:hypothetical protein